MRTFCIQTLGCKVNQYESEQIATLLRSRGLVETGIEQADLRVVNSCSVTSQAASKSRQTTRRATRLPVLTPSPGIQGEGRPAVSTAEPGEGPSTRHSRVILTGCWATSDKAQAERIPGVDAVITHHDNVADQLARLLEAWNEENLTADTPGQPKPSGDEGSIIPAGTSAAELANHHTLPPREAVKQELPPIGTQSLPQLNSPQSTHQRALLKIQDGCDAHCTYCIIPQLRPGLWSKPIAAACDEAQRLVDCGHAEIVLTGIFLGGYGHSTALRRRQGSTDHSLAHLIEALCTRVRGLRRLRLSSLEPGDLDANLLAVLTSHEQCVPHLHLPLQSGSENLLRRMNRQYSRGEFLRMIDTVHRAFDRPAVTTDIIVGFPGETEHEFEKTLDVVDRVRFIHIHAFSYSPRPGTAAARWKRDIAEQRQVNARIDALNDRSRRCNLQFRTEFLDEKVQVLVEHPGGPVSHGRTERYFDVCIDGANPEPGQLVRVRIDRVTPQRTWGTVVRA